MDQLLSQYKGDHKSVFVVFIGDTHFGNRYYSPVYLNKALEFVKRNRNRCRVVLMGDLLELATKTSVGRSVYDESFPTQKQFELAVETFKPYADLVDVVLEGNHEERIIKDTSFEITQEFCHRIDRFAAYGKFSSVLNIIMDSGLVYSIFAWHGAGAGTTDMAATNMLLKMSERCLAHVYAAGHTHKLFSVSRSVKLPNSGGKELLEVERLFVNTGAALEYGGYGEQKGYGLTKAGFGAVQLFSGERKMRFYTVDDLLQGVGR